MAVVRTYECETCNIVFEAWHASGDEAAADCPVCVRMAAWRPQPPNITTHKARAIDITQQVLEQDYGITDFNDRQREGDIAFKSEPETREKRDQAAQIAEQVRTQLNADPVAAAMAANDPATAAALKNPTLGGAMSGFWGGAGGGLPINPSAALAAARTGPAGGDPMSLLHKAVERDPVKNMRPLGVYRG